jgi:hypothetical protein
MYLVLFSNENDVLWIFSITSHVSTFSLVATWNLTVRDKSSSLNLLKKNEKKFVRLLMSALYNVANRIRAAQSKVNCIYFILLRFSLPTNNYTTKRNLKWFKTKKKSHYIYFRRTQISSMADKIKPSLLTLPVELVYRIFDHLNNFSIVCSIPNVCTRINTIVNIYYRYRVNFFFILMFHHYHLQRIIHRWNKHHIPAVLHFGDHKPLKRL